MSESTHTVYQGGIIHSTNLDALEILPNATLITNSKGNIVAFHKTPPDSQELPQNAITHDIPLGDFLIPGFVDTHNHAPQYPMRGLGQGLHILDWLEKITFPHEARFADPGYARKAYESCVEAFLRQGITTASYYGSSHAEATCILADVCLQKGQRALVGKCNMDWNAPDSVRDRSAKLSLQETRMCIEHIRGLDQGETHLVRPVLTPRFAICCSSELLTGLGEIARTDESIAVQTHFNEAQQEISATRELFPEFQSECDLYESFGLLGSRSILAHCTIMTDYEKRQLKELRCGVAHCPIANMTVGGGFVSAKSITSQCLGSFADCRTDGRTYRRLPTTRYQSRSGNRQWRWFRIGNARHHSTDDHCFQCTGRVLKGRRQGVDACPSVLSGYFRRRPGAFPR